MAKVLITPIFDPETPREPSDQFKALEDDITAQQWRGRGSVMELPTGGAHGAGGNADDDGEREPIDSLHAAAKRSFHISGPASVSGKGSTPTGGKGR